jgi:hypothetical protein
MGVSTRTASPTRLPPWQADGGIDEDGIGYEAAAKAVSLGERGWRILR